ncbi:MAG TPA: DUF2752 domain-containing protein [Polyangiaceae bacterium]|nr:DUF2752 domain-containing protein [Polyangiaceae bacterium]
MTTASSNRAVATIAVLALVAASVGVSLCPFATLTGLPCPGCGILRALVALARGDVRGSIHLHPLASLATLLVLAGLVLFRKGNASSRTRELGFAFAGSALLVAMLGVWVARFGGAFGGPVPVNSIWSAMREPNPVLAILRGDRRPHGGEPTR